MLKGTFKLQTDFSNQFIEKATITDIVFLLYCVIYPFFLPMIFYSIFLFSLVGLAYMKKVINSIPLFIFKDVGGENKNGHC